MKSGAQDGRRQRRSRELRDRIVDAAEVELAERGVEAFSVERVAARADVALQTVYNRVGRRDALLLAAAGRALDRDRAYMDAAYEPTAAAQVTLEAAALAYVRFAVEHPVQFRLLAQPPGPPWTPELNAGTAAEVAEQIAAAVETQNARLKAALAAAIANGSARPVDPDLAAIALWAMLNGVLALSWRADRLRVDPERLQALTHTALDLLRNGLAKQPAP